MMMVCLPREREGRECSDDCLLALGKSVLEAEANELLHAAGRLGKELTEAARLIHGCTGRLVVVGMGKSGIIGRKIAATRVSTLGMCSRICRSC